MAGGAMQHNRLSDCDRAIHCDSQRIELRKHCTRSGTSSATESTALLGADIVCFWQEVYRTYTPTEVLTRLGLCPSPVTVGC